MVYGNSRDFSLVLIAINSYELTWFWSRESQGKYPALTSPVFEMKYLKQKHNLVSVGKHCPHMVTLIHEEGLHRPVRCTQIPPHQHHQSCYKCD